jgi:hypothetical protein
VIVETRKNESVLLVLRGIPVTRKEKQKEQNVTKMIDEIKKTKTVTEVMTKKKVKIEKRRGIENGTGKKKRIRSTTKIITMRKVISNLL